MIVIKLLNIDSKCYKNSAEERWKIEDDFDLERKGRIWTCREEREKATHHLPTKDDASENLINKFCKNQSNEEQSQVRKIRV